MMEESSSHLFNKGFMLITLINFIVFLIYYCFVVITAQFASQELNASSAQAGLATGIFIIGTLVARLYIGKTLELTGRKLILRLGALLYVLTTIGYLFSSTVLLLDGVRFLNGFAYGMVSTAANAIVTSYIPESKHGEGINYYGLSTSLAAAVGPFIGMLLLPLFGFRFIIWVAILLSLLTLILCFTFPVKNITLSPKEKAALTGWTWDRLIEKKVLFISTIAFFIGLAYSSVLTFLSTYATELNLISASAFFFVVYALAVTFTRPMTGRLFDAKGVDSVMYPSFIFLTLGLGLLAFTTTSWMLLVSGACIGLGYGTFMSNGQAVCLKSVDLSKIGIALSTYFIGLDLGLGVGPYILGILHSVLSYQGLYLLCALIPVIIAIIYRLFYHPVFQERKETVL